MRQLTIEAPDSIKKKKTRRFSAILLGYITADLMWEGGSAKTDDDRPIYLAVAGPPTTLNPFLANLRSGRKAVIDNKNYSRTQERIQCLKSAGYETTTTTVGRDSVATLMLPELFAVDPGMIDPHVCRFLSIPPAWWTSEQFHSLLSDQNMVNAIIAHARSLGLMSDGRDRLLPIPRQQSAEEILRLIPLATHFALCLDRRTRRPIITDPRFFLQLFVSALHHGLASVPGWSGYPAWGHQEWAKGFKMVGTNEMGFSAGVMFTAQHQGGVDAFLSKNVQMYQGVVS